MEDEENFVFHNYPAGGSDSTVRELVAFGPISKDIVILAEVSPETSEIKVTVGNGPAHDVAPTEVAHLLRSIADAVEFLNDYDAYWDAVDELRE